MVAAECGTQLAYYRLEHGAYEKTGAGQAIGYTLCYGNQVRLDAVVLMGKELAAAAVAALDLIQNHDSAISGACLTYAVHVLIGRNLDSAHTLDTFNNEGSHIALGELSLCCLQITPGQISHVPACVDGSYDLRIIGNLNSQ